MRLLHVVPGKLMKADLEKAAATSLTTAGGGKIATADVPASNGVVHIVDSGIAAPNG